VLHHRAQVDLFAPQLDPPAADAADVEQIIHQSDEVADLAFQRLQG
jgi:hypothetical protein